MATPVDEITGQPIPQVRLSPPDVVAAENGYVLRTYDVANDSYRYRIAQDADTVRAALNDWAEEVAAALRQAAESRAKAAFG